MMKINSTTQSFFKVAFALLLVIGYGTSCRPIEELTTRVTERILPPRPPIAPVDSVIIAPVDSVIEPITAPTTGRFLERDRNVIDGDVSIRTASDLAQYDDVTYITGDVRIVETSLVNLEGAFNQLRKTRRILVRGNPNLASITNSFVNLNRTDAVLISRNSRLGNIPPFAALTTVRDIGITFNDNIQRFTAFENLATVRTINISRNPILTTFIAFPEIAQVQSVDINANPALITFLAFDDLAQAGYISIRRNAQLNRVPAFLGLSVDITYVEDNSPQLFIPAGLSLGSHR